MQKLFLSLLSCLLFAFLGCSTNSGSTNLPNDNTESPSIFPVTSYLKGQLLEIDSAEITPLKLTIQDGKTDSVWLKREEVRSAAAPFLKPEIDSASMSSLFSTKSFLDQTINAYTFTQDPKVKLPDSIDLRHWDVYMSPQTNKITRIYLVKERTVENVEIATQLTWLADKSFTIRTITQAPGKQPVIKEEKIIWNFDE